MGVDVLWTARLRLDPVDPAADADELFVVLSDPEVLTFWHRPGPADVADTREHLAAMVRGCGARSWVLRAVDGGPALGFVGLLGDTTIPGVQWLLRRESWGCGYATEAVLRVVDHVLTDLGEERVEAWVDAENTRSLGVARRAGLVERGRLPQRYPHRERARETIVLGRSAQPEATPVLSLAVELPVTDVAETARVLTVLTRGWVPHGEPEFAVVGLGPWSAGPGVHLVRASPAEIHPVSLSWDTAGEFESVRSRARELALPVSEPVVQPWGRREFVVELADGHQVTVSGPA